jgi:hypothetical protein
VLWSHGEVELTPSVVCTGELPKRTCGSIIFYSSREFKEPIRLELEKERSCELTWARGQIGLRHFGIRAQIMFLYRR